MELKELGKTGVMLPEIGLGTSEYTGGVEPLRRGIDLGAFHIDTAEMYNTEEVVGEAVRERRDQVFIATKVLGSHLKYDQAMAAADASLRKLGMDYIDLYYIHWPDPRVPIGETMRAMEDLVGAGKVRFIGVSQFSTRELEEAQAAMTRYEIVTNQVLYNLVRREIEAELLPYCQRNHITVTAYTPLAYGALASRPLLRHRKVTAALQRIARETDKTMAQVALNWCISRDNVITIPKSNRTERVEEDSAASGWRLSPEQMEALDAAGE